MATVLVTGGAGFIGSHIVEALVARGDRVRVLDDLSTGSLDHLVSVSGAIEFIRGDVTDLDDVRRAMHGATHVIHEAAIRAIPKSLDDPALCNRVNIGGALNVLMAAREATARRVVMVSSSSVYGDAARYPVAEDALTHPMSPYAVTKLASEWYAQLFRELYGMSIICLRYFNVFGPQMDATSGYAMAIPRFIETMLRDEQPPVHGDGLQARDFLYVADAVQATLCALDISEIGPGVYNIGSGREATVLDVIGILNRLIGKRITPRYLPAKPGESRRTLADIARARQWLGFTPAVSFEEGLTRTIAWFRQQQEHAALAHRKGIT